MSKNKKKKNISNVPIDEGINTEVVKNDDAKQVEEIITVAENESKKEGTVEIEVVETETVEASETETIETENVTETETEENAETEIKKTETTEATETETAEIENSGTTEANSTDATEIEVTSEDTPKKERKGINFWNIIKVLFSICITAVASVVSSEPKYFLFGTLEILLIYSITDIIHKKSKIAANIFNSLLYFLYNLQVAVLIFGSTFITRVMITNLTSLGDLEGKATIYISATVIVIIVSFLKFKENSYDVKISKALAIGIIFILTMFFMRFEIIYSPLMGYYTLMQDEISHYTLMRDIRNNNTNKSEFYNSEVEDVVAADKQFSDNPNVILIFTEGLSQNIVLDERNIMPNIKKYEEKSINFTGYYNHTFATYRGLIGQLFSGYQNENLDENHLVSIQSVLKDNGYVTCFINTEPKNKEFTKYLKKLGFDDVVTTKKTQGAYGTLSDKQAYDELLTEAKRLSSINKPFFISIYTFGTHVSLDSRNEKFGDGANSLLNKFYDVDYQFGKFMEEFENSKLFDNTIIVFTTDHCSYKDLDYASTFEDTHERTYTMLDDIPLLIYHKNIEHQDIDVNGRNSLCLAPTILDYLDISAPNYFLGTSLFSGAESGSELEYAYQCEMNYCTTRDRVLSTDNRVFDEDLKQKISDYFAVCSQ